MKRTTPQLLEKADRALQFARQALQEFGPEFTVGRAYYAMFYAASAALEEENITRKRHSGVHTAFADRFVRTNRVPRERYQWLIEAFNARTIDDYEPGVILDEGAASQLIDRAEAFVETVRQVLQG